MYSPYETGILGMIERLALPEWNTSPTRLEAWVEAFRSLGFEVGHERESTGVCWITVGGLLVRGYAVMQGGDVEAINFELAGPDPSAALSTLDEAARMLGWAIHDESDEPDDEDE